MTFQPYEFTLRGLRSHLHVAGHTDHTQLYLLHGLFDTGASFAPLVEALQATSAPLYCIAPDWRGHGDSGRAAEGYWFPDYVADLDALLSALSPDQPVILAGHSMGGQVASMYAGARPERVSHLITLDSLNIPDAAVADTAKRYRNWLNGLQHSRPARTFASIEDIGTRIRHRYPELNTDMCRQLARNWARPATDGRWRLAFDPRHRLPFPYGFRAQEAMALWRQVSAPTLCLDAEYGFSQTRMSADIMAERRHCFSQLQHEVIPDCGHMLHMQAPIAVAASIDRFLSSVCASQN